MRKCWPNSGLPWLTSRGWAPRRCRRKRTARTSRPWPRRLPGPTRPRPMFAPSISEPRCGYCTGWRASYRPRRTTSNVFRTSNRRSFACASAPTAFASTITAIPSRFSPSSTAPRPTGKMAVGYRPGRKTKNRGRPIRSVFHGFVRVGKSAILLLHFADCAVYEDDFPVAVLVNLPQATLEGHVQGPSQDRDDFAFGLADGDVPSRPRRRAVLSGGLHGPPGRRGTGAGAR